MIKPQQVWGIYNYGRLFDICYRRKDAVHAVEQITGKSWREARKYMQIVKVIVMPNNQVQRDAACGASPAP